MKETAPAGAVFTWLLVVQAWQAHGPPVNPFAVKRASANPKRERV
jgi:hypothetical protein